MQFPLFFVQKKISQARPNAYFRYQLALLSSVF